MFTHNLQLSGITLWYNNSLLKPAIMFKYYLQVILYKERLYSLQGNNYQIHLPICNKRLKVLISPSVFPPSDFPIRSNKQTVIATYRDHNQLCKKSSKYYTMECVHPYQVSCLISYVKNIDWVCLE